MTVVHIEPVNDVIEHDCDGGTLCDCVCGPEVTFMDGAVIVSHHSLDGREIQERS